MQRLEQRYKIFICAHIRSEYFFATLINLIDIKFPLDIFVLLKSDASKEVKRISSSFYRMGQIKEIISVKESEYSAIINSMIESFDDLIFWIEDDVIVDNEWFLDAKRKHHHGYKVIGSAANPITFKHLDYYNINSQNKINGRLQSPERNKNFINKVISKKVNFPGRLLCFDVTTFTDIGIKEDSILFNELVRKNIPFTMSKVQHLHIGLYSDLHYDNYTLLRDIYISKRFFFFYKFIKRFLVRR